MRLGLHDRLDERDRGGTDLGGFSPHPARRPFCVAPMRAWHVFGDRRVAMSCVRASVARHSGALVQNLDRGVGDARFQLLANEARRHRVIVIGDLDVIVGRSAALLPFGILIRRGWKSFQREPIDLCEQFVAAHPKLTHDLGVEVGDTLADRCVELMQ